LIEDGFEVVATDTWPMMRRHLRPGMKPRLVLVDLKDLPDPVSVLNDLSVLMNPRRVMVLMAAGTVPETDIQRRGFHVLPRPIVIAHIVETAARLIRSTGIAGDASS
jgi:hypothetical protein